MKNQTYWLLVCAAGAAACASSNPEARPDATRREPASAVVVTRREPARAVVPLEGEPRVEGEPRARTAPRVRERARVAAVHNRAPARVDASHVAPAADDSAEPGATAAADNTKVNERDRDDRTLTAMDQGNGEHDVKITQQIRQSVMDDDSLSFNAKNVKIITVDGKVTLRGPVASSKERTRSAPPPRRSRAVLV